MARDHARILYSLWSSSSDFLRMSADAQRLYVLIFSQPSLSYAGVAPYTIRRWAKLASDTTEDDVRAAVKELAAARYLVVDEDTEEVFVRSYMRNDHILANPNVAIAAVRAYHQIASMAVRAAWLTELRRLHAESLQSEDRDKAWTEKRSAPLLDEVLRQADPQPDPPDTPSDLPIEGGTEPLPETPPERGLNTLPERGTPTCTRARRASSPTPTPSPSPRGSAPYLGHPREARDLEPPPSDVPPTLVEELITEHRDNSPRGIPSKLAEQLAGEIHRLARDGFTRDEIREGLGQLRARRLGAGALSNLVDELANAQPSNVLALPVAGRNATPPTRRPSATDRAVAEAMEVAAHFEALEQAEAQRVRKEITP